MILAPALSRLVWNKGQKTAKTKQLKRNTVSSRSPEGGHHSQALKGDGGAPRADHFCPTGLGTKQKLVGCVFSEASSSLRSQCSSR